MRHNNNNNTAMASSRPHVTEMGMDEYVDLEVIINLLNVKSPVTCKVNLTNLLLHYI